MIEIKITIGELEVENKVRGALMCVTNRTKPTKEELIMEAKVFEHIRMIGKELSEQRGATVNMIEGTGGKKKGGKDGTRIPSNDRGNPGSL
jgi:hypothetical protein